MKIIVKFAFLAILCLTQTLELKTLDDKSCQNSSSYSRFIESNKVDWCDLNCENDEHIGCTTGGKCSTPAAPCDFIKVNPEKLLETHNNLRNEFATGKNPIAPNVRAANMMALSWDNDLAFLAQCNLIKCPEKMTHDHCHRTETVETAGQNLAWSMGVRDCTAYSYQAVQSWYDEYKVMSEDRIKSTTNNFQYNSATGHFTQLVWAETKFLGCAMTMKGKGQDTECMLACNYGPAGNFMEGSMYIEGPPASKCPGGIKPGNRFSGLCGDAEIPRPGKSASEKHKASNFLFLPLLIRIYICK